MNYGYPTIRNVTIAPEEKYLCVSHRAERRWVQPLRLIAGWIAAPTVMLASADVKCPIRQRIVFASGLGMMIWSLSVHHYAKQEMDGAK